MNHKAMPIAQMVDLINSAGYPVNDKLLKEIHTNPDLAWGILVHLSKHALWQTQGDPRNHNPSKVRLEGKLMDAEFVWIKEEAFVEFLDTQIELGFELKDYLVPEKYAILGAMGRLLRFISFGDGVSKRWAAEFQRVKEAQVISQNQEKRSQKSIAVLHDLKTQKAAQQPLFHQLTWQIEEAKLKAKNSRERKQELATVRKNLQDEVESVQKELNEWKKEYQQLQAQMAKGKGKYVSKSSNLQKRRIKAEEMLLKELLIQKGLKETTKAKSHQVCFFIAEKDENLVQFSLEIDSILEPCLESSQLQLDQESMLQSDSEGVNLLAEATKDRELTKDYMDKLAAAIQSNSKVLADTQAGILAAELIKEEKVQMCHENEKNLVEIQIENSEKAKKVEELQSQLGYVQSQIHNQCEEFKIRMKACSQAYIKAADDMEEVKCDVALQSDDSTNWEV